MLPNAFVLLRSQGVMLLLDLTEGRLPAVLHWGADLALDDQDVLRLAAASVPTSYLQPVSTPPRTALLPEHWTGWMGRPGLTGSRDDGSGWSPQFVTQHAQLDGVELPAGPEPRVVSTGSGRVVIQAIDPDAELELSIEIELAETGLVRARAAVMNLAATPFRLDGLAPALPVPRTATDLLDFSGRGTRERIPQRRRLDDGLHLRENRRGHTGHDSAFVLHLGEPGFGFADGEIWAVHTAWSGNHLHYAERLSTGEQVIGGGELLLPGEIQLHQDEHYTSPWLYANYGRGLDSVARRFHAHLRARSEHPASPRPVTINVWEAVYYGHDLPVMLELATTAADLGVERFVLDDGWFGDRRDDTAGLGDWSVSPEVWPEGLHSLVDAVHGLGMQFGLWFEPEGVNPDSRLARAHPEWIMATGGRLPLESRHQQVLNLGIPECYAEIRRQMFAILDEYAIDYIKWDHNRQLLDAGTAPTGRAGVHEQTIAFYRLVDDIKQRHPRIEIESCAGGGGRIDLEVLERTDRIWVSDCIDPLERQSMHRWTGQLVPPELMGTHIASGTSHITGRHHDLSFRAATAIFGHLGIEWDLRQASAIELDELRVWIDFYKQHRDLLHSGHSVRLDHPDETISLHGVVAPDQSRAIFAYAALARSKSGNPGRLRLPGLASDQRYRVETVPPGWQPEATEAPAWWGIGHGRSYEHGIDVQPGPRWRPDVATPGVELSGAALSSIGLAAPDLAPEHAVVYLLTAVQP